ncbi:DUF1176 domain-containing protein [Sphingomonas sp. HF-S3]|uniref:DUF1176 domain-containing protein n=1 Tax=Sphingomonas rustica TaxID=3103142 RepID=A0ABV0B224_9SPHN
MLFTMMLALAAQPAGEKLYGNWAVTCDNVARCEATALQPAGRDVDSYREMRLSREPGPTGMMNIEFWPAARLTGLVDILIDDRLLTTATQRGDTVRVNGATAEGLARAMASGRVLTLRSNRQVVATVSLIGSAAMLRHIDDQQGRADGVTALVARGRRPASWVPASQPLPRIAALRPPRTATRPLSASALRGLPGLAGCRPGGMTTGYHRLDSRTTLAMIPCVAGATNTQHLAFLVRDGRATPARFDRTPDDQGAAGVVGITNYEWSNGELVSSVRNNTGDCGNAHIWVWDGERFRQTLSNELGACWRGGVWLTSYRADPIWR